MSRATTILPAEDAPLCNDGEHWIVVGGEDKGGIIVREGKSLTSKQLLRLGTNSIVRSLSLKDGRLWYALVSGSGPQSGWVSIRAGGKELLRRHEAFPLASKAKPPTMPPPAVKLAVRAEQKVEERLEMLLPEDVAVQKVKPKPPPRIMSLVSQPPKAEMFVEAIMSVTLVTMSGQELPLKLQGKTTVAKVLEEEAPDNGDWLFTRKRLVRGTEELAGEKTLEEQGVMDGERLTLVQSRRNCVLVAGKNAELWCVETATIMKTYKAHSAPVVHVCGEDGFVLTASLDKTAKLWCACTGYVIHTFRHGQGIDIARFSPSRREVITGSSVDRSLAIWCQDWGDCLHRLYTEAPFPDAVFSRCGQWLLTRGVVKDRVQVWCKSRRCLLTFKATCMPAFSPLDDELLVATEHDISVWSITTGRQCLTLARHGGPVCHSAVSPDGAQLLTIGATVKLWSSSTGECLHTLAEDLRAGYAEFSSDGQQFLTFAKLDFEVCLWCAATAQRLSTFKGSAGVLSATFAPAGQDILLRLSDRSALVWTPATDNRRHLPPGVVDFMR